MLHFCMNRILIEQILIRWVIALSVSLLGSVSSSQGFSVEDDVYWFFQPISHPKVPAVENDAWVRNPIDAFILAQHEAHKITPSPEVDRRTLIRRATLDLLGLPPTMRAIDEFVSDPDPNAYEKLIDRLLDSPRYGERYARHWLDLVRYADSDGFKSDVLRPDAWRYRDFVIDSFNQDKPYARFVKEQIAGDELYPGDDDAKKATGYLRLWPYEDNQPDFRRHWEATLDDIADVSGDVFLGLSMKCARCHDHKFDAITEEDYYRFRAFFAAISPWDDIRLGDENAVLAFRQQLATWESMTAEIRNEMDAIKADSWEKQWALARGKLPPYMHEILDKAERTPYEEQLARFAVKMMTHRSEVAYEKGIKGEKKKRWDELKKRLSSYATHAPKELDRVAAIRDVGAVAPLTYLGGDSKRQLVMPGYLSILAPGDAKIDPIVNVVETTGRRAALARWLTDGENPLTARLMVNRLWQWHFGAGIVASSNDFGELGGQPSHPKLLDWLARKFVQEQWSIKAMHRLIMTSATYRQSSAQQNAAAMVVDAENNLLWAMRSRRMDAEQLRDSILFVSGEIDTEMGGPAVAEEKTARRSIYVLNKRNKLATMMNSFDTPDLHNSCAMRDNTTTTIQALTLLNGAWAVSRAERFADLVLSDDGVSVEERIANAYRLALGRAPTQQDIADAHSFLKTADSQNEANRTAWVDFCHVLMNTNEFIYIH